MAEITFRGRRLSPHYVMSRHEGRDARRRQIEDQGGSAEGVETWKGALNVVRSSFNNNFRLVVREVAIHVRSRWSHCVKALEASSFQNLCEPQYESDGETKIPLSSKISQHRRAALLGGQFLKGAFAVMLLEIRDSAPRDEDWKSLMKFHDRLQEEIYLKDRRTHIEAEQQLDAFLKSLKSELNPRPKEGESELSSVGAFGVSRALDDHFHLIATALGNGIAGFYQVLEGDVREWQKSGKDRHDGVQRRIETLKRNVPQILECLKLESLRDFVYASFASGSMSEPAEVYDFNIAGLSDRFTKVRAMCMAPDDFRLEVSIPTKVEEAVNKLDLGKRIALGVVFNNLLLNAVQGLKKRNLKQDAELPSVVEVSGRRGRGTLHFEVTTRGVRLSKEKLQTVKAIIDNPLHAKARAGLIQGGNGLANLTMCLTDSNGFNAKKPQVRNGRNGVIFSFEVTRSGSRSA